MKKCSVCSHIERKDAPRCSRCGNSIFVAADFTSVSHGGSFREKVIALIKALLYVALFMAIPYAAVIVCVIVLSVITGDASVLDNMSSDANSIFQIAIDLVFLGILAVFFLLRRKSLREEIRLVSFPLSAAPTCAIFGYCANLVFVVGIGLIPWPQSLIDQQFEAYEYIGADDASLILTVLSTAVITGIVEETVFRGLAVSRLRRAFGKSASVVISAAIFAAAHPTVMSMAYTFILGIFLGVLFIRYNSVLPCMIVHIFFNLAACIDLPEGDTAIFIAVVISFVMFIGSAIVLFGINSKANSNSQINEKVSQS